MENKKETTAAVEQKKIKKTDLKNITINQDEFPQKIETPDLLKPKEKTFEKIVETYRKRQKRIIKKLLIIKNILIGFLLSDILVISNSVKGTTVAADILLIIGVGVTTSLILQKLDKFLIKNA